MTRPHPDHLDDSAVSLLLLSNLCALLAAAGAALVGVGFAAMTGVAGDDGWESFGILILFGFGSAAVVYLGVLAWCVNRWIATGRGVVTALATVGGAVFAGVAAGTVLASLDDGRGSEDVVVGWLAVGLVVIVQGLATSVLAGRVASVAAVAILSLMVVAGVAL